MVTFSTPTVFCFAPVLLATCSFAVVSKGEQYSVLVFRRKLDWIPYFWAPKNARERILRLQVVKNYYSYQSSSSFAAAVAAMEVLHTA